MARPPRRTKAKDLGRKPKKKVSILLQENVEYIDWKDVNLLRRFTSDRAKIRARRVTGNDARQQKAVALAVKNAREMALLPYTNRVTTHRGGRNERRDRDGDRDGRRGNDNESVDEAVLDATAEEFEPIEVEGVTINAEGGEG